MVNAEAPQQTKKKTPWWVILLAVVGGLVVLGWIVSAMGDSDENGWHEKGAIAVDEDRFVNFGFEAFQDLRFNGHFSVSSGPNIEVLVMDELNFQNFQQGASSVYQVQCSRTGLSSTWDCELPKGIWYVVIDNTDQGNEAPPFDAQNNLAVVDYDFSIEPL